MRSALTVAAFKQAICSFVPQGINKREVVRAYADSGKGSQLF